MWKATWILHNEENNMISVTITKYIFLFLHKKLPCIVLLWVSLPLGKVWVEGGKTEEVCRPGTTGNLWGKINSHWQPVGKLFELTLKTELCKLATCGSRQLQTDTRQKRSPYRLGSTLGGVLCPTSGLTHGTPWQRFNVHLATNHYHSIEFCKRNAQTCIYKSFLWLNFINLPRSWYFFSHVTKNKKK